MLPDVYANKIDKVIKNNTDYYRDSSNRKNVDLSTLKGYFDSKGYYNRLSVLITTKDNNTRVEKLVLCKNDYFVNVNNEKIYFGDIVDYEIKK